MPSGGGQLAYRCGTLRQRQTGSPTLLMNQNSATCQRAFGGLYRKDATEAEMRRMSKTGSEPPASGKVFAGHYPSNLDLYYPGFEVFVWKAPFRTSIRGIEEGPADRAGIHPGDAIVSVDGVNPEGKSIDELEQLLSSPKPAKMTLIINRDDEIKTFSFELAKASDVAALNGKRRYEGRMIPSVIPEGYLHCWNARATKP
jgi:PDZ domain